MLDRIRKFHEGKPPKRPETQNVAAKIEASGFTRASRRSGLRPILNLTQHVASGFTRASRRSGLRLNMYNLTGYALGFTRASRRSGLRRHKELTS